MYTYFGFMLPYILRCGEFYAEVISYYYNCT